MVVGIGYRVLWLSACSVRQGADVHMHSEESMRLSFLKVGQTKQEMKNRLRWHLISLPEVKTSWRESNPALLESDRLKREWVHDEWSGQRRSNQVQEDVSCDDVRRVIALGRLAAEGREHGGAQTGGHEPAPLHRHVRGRPGGPLPSDWKGLELSSAD